MRRAFEFRTFTESKNRYFCTMQLNMLKTYWVLIFILAMTIVKSDNSLISAASPVLNEQVQQGTSHHEHFQLFAEPITNVEDEQDETRRKIGIEGIALNSSYFVECLARLSPMVGYLFRFSIRQSSIPIRLQTSIFRI